MISLVKSISAILVFLSVLGIVMAVVELFSLHISSGVAEATLIGGFVICLLLSGALWLLADIAESVRRIPRQP